MAQVRNEKEFLPEEVAEIFVVAFVGGPSRASLSNNEFLSLWTEATNKWETRKGEKRDKDVFTCSKSLPSLTFRSTCEHPIPLVASVVRILCPIMPMAPCVKY